MAHLASCALHALLACAPQGDSPAAAERPPLLTASEQASLRDKIVKYFEALDAYERAESSKDREKASKPRDKAKEAMRSEWETRGKKGNLLASMADLRAIYDACFPAPAPRLQPGTMRKEKDKDTGIEFTVAVPKGYKPQKPVRTILALPGTTAPDQAAAWVDGEKWFAGVYDKTPLLEALVHVVHLPAGIEMDPVPDFSRDGQEAQEDKRYATVFQSFALTKEALTYDRGRLFLDCGRGNCGFGLRFASVFPTRFAGLVLRHPVLPDDLRLGSLTGMPVLLLKSAKTAEAVAALQAKLEALQAGTVTVVETTDEYPHKAAAAEIDTWMQKQKRNIAPAKVVIEPNHDRFRSAYWVEIGKMAVLHAAPLADRPRIEVTADRASNRLVVKARGIEGFTLYLNDDLLDLDKEFSVVVNDKAVSEKRARDLFRLEQQLVQRKDWEFLFPVKFDSLVPKPPKPDDKPAGTDGK
jgi:hypothetical protein